MKFITNYRELGEPTGDSLLNHRERLSKEKKTTILTYLKTGNRYAICCSLIYDYVTDEQTADTIYAFTDGEYKWDSEEIYHFEKYDIALDAQFVRKVLRQAEEKEQKG